MTAETEESSTQEHSRTVTNDNYPYFGTVRVNMPKKQLKKRIAECAEEYAEHILHFAAEQTIISKPDNDLFTLDRAGSKTSRKRIAKIQSNKSSSDTKSIVSVTERKLVERAIAKHLQQKIDASKGVHPVKQGEITDLWDETANESSLNKLNTKRRRTVDMPVNRKVTIAIGGQSYNPSHEDHQNALAEALAIELKKREEEARAKGPLDTTLSELTKSVLVEGFDSDEDDDDDDDDVDGTEQPTKRRKMEKLTRAQRNKIKARNIATFESNKEAADKMILKGLDRLPEVLKSIEAEEKRRANMKAFREAQKKETTEKGALSKEEAVLVPLSDELRGSLRTILPKGCAVKDQARSMRVSGDLMAQDRRKRKAYEKPHASKQIKWHAKYKYE